MSCQFLPYSKMNQSHGYIYPLFLGFPSHLGQVCKCAQSCLTLCDPMDYSPQGSFVHGFLQASILEWVVLPFYRVLSPPMLILLNKSYSTPFIYLFLDIISFQATVISFLIFATSTCLSPDPILDNSSCLRQQDGNFNLHN